MGKNIEFNEDGDPVFDPPVPINPGKPSTNKKDPLPPVGFDMEGNPVGFDESRNATVPVIPPLLKFLIRQLIRKFVSGKLLLIIGVGILLFILVYRAIL